MHPIELSNAYAALLKDFNYGDQTKLAQKLGVSNSHLSEVLSLNRLPEDIKNYLLENNIRKRSLLRKVVNERDLETVKMILGGDKEQLAKKERRKFALRVYFQGDNAVLGGIQKKMSKQQRESLVQQLKELIEKFGY